jgi:phenylacetic acid degradation operon negative regulatory protein
VHPHHGARAEPVRPRQAPHVPFVAAAQRLARRQRAQVNLGAVTVFRAQHVELVAASGRDPIDAWDIPAIAEEYASFVRHWSMLLPRIGAGRVAGAEAVRARSPYSCCRPDGHDSVPREVFAAVYDGLAEAAEEHVRAVVARYADDAQLSVHAHTITAMMAGVRDTPHAAEPTTPHQP